MWLYCLQTKKNWNHISAELRDEFMMNWSIRTSRYSVFCKVFCFLSGDDVRFAAQGQTVGEDVEYFFGVAATQREKKAKQSVSSRAEATERRRRLFNQKTSYIIFIWKCKLGFNMSEPLLLCAPSFLLGRWFLLSAEQGGKWGRKTQIQIKCAASERKTGRRTGKSCQFGSTLWWITERIEWKFAPAKLCLFAWGKVFGRRWNWDRKSFVKYIKLCCSDICSWS